MNTQHLKYVLEVEKAGSISRAAENLYMNQPHLSKVIKELEDSLGITIFKRTTRGVSPTKKGAEFLFFARKVLQQINELEDLYKPNGKSIKTFDIAVPRASYISHTFTEFVERLSGEAGFNFNYRETNSVRAIRNVADGVNNLGVVRYQQEYESYFRQLIKNKGLKCRKILDFSYLAIMSEEHPLAHKETLALEDFAGYIEIVHGDISVPSLPFARMGLGLQDRENGRTIAIYERGSQFELLNSIKTTYMWVSPVPEKLRRIYALVQRECRSEENRYRDILIYRNGYTFTEEDRLFIEILGKVTCKLTP